MEHKTTLGSLVEGLWTSNPEVVRITNMQLTEWRERRDPQEELTLAEFVDGLTSTGKEFLVESIEFESDILFPIRDHDYALCPDERKIGKFSIMKDGIKELLRWEGTGRKEGYELSGIFDQVEAGIEITYEQRIFVHSAWSYYQKECSRNKIDAIIARVN